MQSKVVEVYLNYLPLLNSRCWIYRLATPFSLVNHSLRTNTLGLHLCPYDLGEY